MRRRERENLRAAGGKRKTTRRRNFLAGIGIGPDTEPVNRGLVVYGSSRDLINWATFHCVISWSIKNKRSYTVSILRGALTITLVIV